MSSHRYRDDLTAELVRSLLDYNPDTGVFIWRANRSTKVRAGDVAGSNTCGYIEIKINGTSYKAHRLAWLWMTNEWPINELDHINRIKDDNRFCNLRKATHSQNRINTLARDRDLPQGVWRIPNGKFKVMIMGVHLGTFNTPGEASAAYVDAAQDLYGEFYREASNEA